MTKTGIGQDSHAFIDNKNDKKPLILGGIIFENARGLKGNSDADVVLHSLTNAISSITGNNILGSRADNLCQQGITDSAEYLKLALQDLGPWRINHIAIAIECLNPKIAAKINELKSNIADLTSLKSSDVGITATTGEGLSAFGKGEGIQVFSIVSAYYE
ncbi:MAG: 2-C-methyl-D-erythritol 2,4-cyclodiphosphate synthase [Candidatus Thioglobus sp.]|nr:MAG: 2-C-methyl-D-erythritol 2,4-cyclodiphosphate synthase [Candidatus Thioglobus sp.]